MITSRMISSFADESHVPEFVAAVEIAGLRLGPERFDVLGLSSAGRLVADSVL